MKYEYNYVILSDWYKSINSIVEHLTPPFPILDLINLSIAPVDSLKIGISSGWWHNGVLQIITVAFLLIISPAGGL